MLLCVVDEIYIYAECRLTFFLLLPGYTAPIAPSRSLILSLLDFTVQVTSFQVITGLFPMSDAKPVMTWNNVTYTVKSKNDCIKLLDGAIGAVYPAGNRKVYMHSAYILISSTTHNNINIHPAIVLQSWVHLVVGKPRC